MALLRKLFPPLPYRGSPRLELRDRCEELAYEEGELRATVQLTSGGGWRIDPDTLEFETGVPGRAAHERVFSNMLLFLSGRRRKAVIVVLNADDPRRELWLQAAGLRADIPVRFEETSDQEGFDSMLAMWVQALASGGSVQFGLDGARARSRQDLEQEIERRREERRRERDRQRTEFVRIEA